ncbi:hypothetical protein GOBAR_AA20302 [Gossypium barbadense]|uniref:Uncharacterized protein n=1 Tax=Gossypium barbadense TaxID=3634 RepID=A0A2P5XAI7_GOSBA|nr:hypothetical protein GOBAR_AA20302 [Gossypium barbadense]
MGCGVTNGRVAVVVRDGHYVVLRVLVPCVREWPELAILVCNVKTQPSAIPCVDTPRAGSTVCGRYQACGAHVGREDANRSGLPSCNFCVPVTAVARRAHSHTRHHQLKVVLKVLKREDCGFQRYAWYGPPVLACEDKTTDAVDPDSAPGGVRTVVLAYGHSRSFRHEQRLPGLVCAHTDGQHLVFIPDEMIRFWFCEFCVRMVLAERVGISSSGGWNTEKCMVWAHGWSIDMSVEVLGCGIPRVNSRIRCAGRSGVHNSPDIGDVVTIEWWLASSPSKVVLVCRAPVGIDFRYVIVRWAVSAGHAYSAMWFESMVHCVVELEASRHTVRTHPGTATISTPNEEKGTGDVQATDREQNLTERQHTISGTEPKPRSTMTTHPHDSARDPGTTRVGWPEKRGCPYDNPTHRDVAI